MNRQPQRLASLSSVLLLLLGALASLTGCAAGPQPLPDCRDQRLPDHSEQTLPDYRETWNLFLIAGVPHGYSHSVTSKVTDPEPQIVNSTLEVTHLKESQGVHTTRTYCVYRETPEGALISASCWNTGAETNDSEARIHDGKVTVTRHTAGTTHVSEAAWDAEVIGPEAICRKLHESGFPAGKELIFKTYSAQSQHVVHESITIEGRETVTIRGQPLELYKAREVTDEMPGIVARVWLDEFGEEIKGQADVAGGIEILRVSREEALRAAVPGSNLVSFLEDFAIPSDVTFRSPRKVKEVLYRIEGDVEKLNLSDRRQQIEQQGPGWVLLRVKGVPDAEQPAADKPGPEFLAASSEIQSDDPEMQRVARENTDPKASPAANARRLTAWVFNHITNKVSVGGASAKETLRERKGTCKEHAKLLVALLRAAGIPSRVAIGVAYVNGRFYGHMWTEAFLNDWTALDATAPSDFVDATHLKFGAGSLADAPEPELIQAGEPMLQKKLKIKVVEFK